MWVLGYPEGSAAELLDGTLKLCYCTTIFTKQFLPCVLPRLGKGVGKRGAVTSGNLLDCSGNFGKRVRLSRKTRPCSFWIQGIQRRDDGKDYATLPPKERG